MNRNIWISSIEEKRKYENWVKEGINLCIYTDKQSDIQPIDICSKSLNMDSIHVSIDLQSEFDKILLSVTEEVRYNYDYYYLRNALSEGICNNIKTIITGSSYSLFGFDKNELTGSVNLGLSSQDLYYALKGCYNVIENNSNINNIAILAEPYYFYSDLSRTQNKQELSRISKVYKPLYNDVHNALFLEPNTRIIPDSCIWDVSKLLEIYTIHEYQRTYFNEDRPREIFQIRTWSRNCNWIELSEEERVSAGKKRAEEHNKSIKYEFSLLENVSLFNEFIKYCNEKNINVLMVLTPASQYYRAFLESKFREVFYEVLNICDGEVHLLDLYENEEFENEDFNDVDHLSEKGAKKLTKMISELLQSL